MIYIGSGVNPQTRFIAHRAKGKLPDGAVLRVVQWFDKRKDALRAEMAAIAEKSPRLNFVGRRDMTKTTGLVPVWKAELAKAEQDRADKLKAAWAKAERDIMEHVSARMPSDAGAWRITSWEKGDFIVQSEDGRVFRIPQ